MLETISVIVMLSWWTPVVWCRL